MVGKPKKSIIEDMVVGLSSKLGILEAFWPQIFFPSQSTIIREDKINYVVAFSQS